MNLGVPPLQMKSLLESNPLESRSSLREPGHTQVLGAPPPRSWVDSIRIPFLRGEISNLQGSLREVRPEGS